LTYLSPLSAFDLRRKCEKIHQTAHLTEPGEVSNEAHQTSVTKPR
jgi:hypothetical protein